MSGPTVHVGGDVWLRGFLDGLAPPRVLSVAEWADTNRILPPTSAEPGQWRTSRTPYLREIMEALSARSGVELVVFMKGSQVGGSEVVNNWIGATIDVDPGPMLVVQPNVEQARLYVRVRIDPMIEESPSLRARVQEKRSRDSGNTMTEKEFPGGFLRITGANASAGLSSLPVRKLALDEVDRMPLDVEGEGDPVALARTRQITFTDRQTLLVSTPTVEGASRIAKEFAKTDQRYYFVPCPFCAFFQRLVWSNVIAEREDYDDPGNVTYRCAGCGKLIDEAHKGEMLERGEWRATAKSSDTKVRGYHLSALYSPPGFYRWRDAMREFLEATKKNDLERLKAFVNTKLGETWRELGEVPDWQVLHHRREQYKRGIAPRRVLVLTAGVDVQEDRLEVEVVGWGRGIESWSVEYFVFSGPTEKLPLDPAEPSPWNELDALYRRKFKHAEGRELTVAMFGIDSQFNTTTVYQFARRHDPARTRVLRGRHDYPEIAGPPVKVDLRRDGKRRSRGARQWPVGTNRAKGELYAWLRMKPKSDPDAEHPPGFCHFPDYPEEYFRQLTAETLVFKVVKGFKVGEWTKTRERNEALDCRVYARAAAFLLGVDSWDDVRWRQRAAVLGMERAPGARQTAPAPRAVAPPAADLIRPSDDAPRSPQRRPGFIDRDRWRLR